MFCLERCDPNWERSIIYLSVGLLFLLVVYPLYGILSFWAGCIIGLWICVCEGLLVVDSPDLVGFAVLVSILPPILRRKASPKLC